MDRNMFDEDEVPYMTLSRFGLTREMIEDLPERVLEDIFSGHKSPNLPIHIKDSQGYIIHSRTRFALIRKDDGRADVLFFPEMKDCDLSGKTGLRFCNGDYQRWKSQRTQGFEDKSYGLNGCWLRDTEGHLHYVHETDYTEAMWQEQREIAQSRIAHFSR